MYETERICASNSRTEREEREIEREGQFVRVLTTTHNTDRHDSAIKDLGGGDDNDFINVLVVGKEI